MALLAISFVANFVYSGVYLQLSGMPPVGIEVHSSGDSITIWKVETDSPAQAAGAVPGDVIRSFNGRPVRGLNDYLVPEQLMSRDATTHLTVERDGRTLDLPIKVSGSYFASLNTVNRVATIFWILIAALELVLALTLALGRPGNASVLSAALFLAVLTTLNAQSAGFATAFRALPFALKVLIYPIPLLSLEILFFAFVFCANFPRPIFKKKSAWVLCSLPAAAILLYVALLNLPMSFGSRPELLFQVGVGEYFDAVKIPMLVILCGYGIAAVAAIIVNYRCCDRIERRRIKLMLVGALIGMGSVVPAAIIHELIYSDLISRFGFVSIGFGLLRLIFLAFFVHAVLKQKVFEIPVLLQRSGRYLLVQRGFLIMLVMGGVAITVVFARALARTFPAEQGLSIPIGAVFGIVLVGVGTIVHKRVQSRLDRAFFRSAYDAQRILEEMAETSRRATSRAELAELLRARIHQALQPADIAVLLETAPGQLTRFESDGHPSLVLNARNPALAALAVSRRAMELEPKDWESGALLELHPLRPECLVPIIGRSEVLLGLLTLGPKLSEEPYSSGDLRLLQSAATQAGVALENISLAEDIAVRLQTEQLAARELDIARSVQSKLLPDTAPDLASLECVGRCIQARQVGGDFYDFIEYAPGKIGLVLADIAGKGISAALLMANLQAHLRSHKLEEPDDIESALESVNRFFRKSIDVGSFATLFLGFYDDATAVLSYANCGHAPPVVMRRDGKVHRLEATATVVGAFADWSCDVEEVKIEEGDVVVFYSDGITEAENGNGEQFGEARLLELLHGCRGLSADQLLETIIGAVLDFSRNEQLDDITLVVAQSKSIPKVLQRASSSTHLTQ